MRPLRSYLFAPGNNEALLGKVFGAGADGVVLDLEDAVPESEKARARRLVAAALGRVGSPKGPGGPCPVFVRVNSLDSPHWRDDVDAVVIPGVVGVRVPKAEDLAALCRLNDALFRREESAGLAQGSVRVVPTIESARGLFGVDSIARGPRVSGFAFGAADFCADLRADPADETATLHARSTLVVASRARRLAPPIASVYTRLDDGPGLRADTERQKRLGFFGRSAIHPRQVPIIHEALDPTEAEVERARAVVAAFDDAARDGQGASRKDGAFVDLAVVRVARATLELHEWARLQDGGEKP